MAEDLHWLSLLEVSDRIASGAVSPVDLTRTMLARIERLDPVLHAYATVTADRALAAAERAEHEIRGGERRGPLHGVPLAVKDLCDRHGVPTAAGMRLLRDRRPDADATVVTRLEDAGAVLLGQVQMTEGASAVHHPRFERPRNPWRLDYATGSSSSGSGAATAAGLCFGALGSDTAGSIRIPSAWCGLAGLKPTWGRVSRHGVFPLAESLDCVGPMARRTGDCAAMLAVLAGPDPKDPTAAERPVPDYLRTLAQGIGGVRIGLDEAYVTADTAPEVAKAVLDAAPVLRRLGADVREVPIPDVAPAVDAALAILSIECARVHEPWHPSRAAEYGPHLRELVESGRRLTPRDREAAEATRATFRRRLAAFFETIDLLLCPAMFVPPSPATLMESLPGDLTGVSGPMRFTAPFNLAGSPSLTLPCGVTPDGLPLALQLVGRHFEEELLLRAGHAWESATEWHRRHPPEP